MNRSFHAITTRRSPLAETQMAKGGSKKKHGTREMVIALPLTSLIDAFSIIVIYLLIGTQSNGLETPIPTSLNLPVAGHSIIVDKEMPVLRIQKGQFFLNEKSVTSQSLTARLTELKKEITAKLKASATTEEAKPSIELMIQADTEMDYADLDPLIKASSLAGIEKLKFAVVPSR